jgi:hypothetical protein
MAGSFDVTDAKRLSGPLVAANPVDKRVLRIGLPANRIVRGQIAVITDDGRVFSHEIGSDSVGEGRQHPGPPVGANPADKWVVASVPSGIPIDFFFLDVITDDGRYFRHRVDVNGGVHDASHIDGPRVAANNQDRRVMSIGSGRTLVATDTGGIFSHEITSRVGDARHHPGPPVASQSVDKWVVVTEPMGGPTSANGSVFVITQDGSVFVHGIGLGPRIA